MRDGSAATCSTSPTPRDEPWSSASSSSVEAEVVPALPRLRRSVVHGDANGHNVLVGGPRAEPREVVSVIDFGDMHHGLTVSEPAIAAAYALLGSADPLPQRPDVVAGYHGAFPLEEAEIALLYPLIAARLAVSVTNSAWRTTLRPDDPYVTISEAPAWEALERLAANPPPLRALHVPGGVRPPAGAAGRDGGEMAEGERGAGRSRAGRRPAHRPDPRARPQRRAACMLGADPRAAGDRDAHRVDLQGDEEGRRRGGVGRYDEARGIYTTALFGAGERPTDERRTVHLGIDLFVEPGTSVHAPLDGHGARAREQRGAAGLRAVRHPAARDRRRGTVLHALRPPDRGHARRVSRSASASSRASVIGARGRAADERRLDAAPPPPDHRRPVGPGSGLPGRGARQPARGVDGPLAGPERASWASPSTRFPAAEPTPVETLAARRERLGPQPERVLPPAAQDRARLDAVPLRRDGPRATSTSTTTCRSSGTATRGWCGPCRRRSRSSTRTRATCTTP